MRGSSAVVAAACAFAACIDPGATTVDVPEGVDLVTILTVDEADMLVEATTLSPIGDGGPVFTDADHRTHLVGYTQDDLDSSTPPMVVDDMPLRAAERCDAALPAARWFVDWSDDTFVDRDPADAPSLTLESQRRDCAATCRRFDTTTIVIEGTAMKGFATIGVRIDADTVLIGARDPASAYVVSRDGTSTSTTIPVGAPLLGAFNGPDGLLWFITDGGTIHTGRWGALALRSEGGMPPPRGHRGRLVLDDPSVPDDLVAVTDDYFMVRYDGQTWREVASYSGEDGRLEIDVARVGPNESFVLGISTTVMHETAAGIEPVPLGTSGISGATVVTRVPGFGVVAATNFARLYRWQDAWVELPEEPPIFAFPRVVIPLGDAFLVGGTAGVLTEYRFEQGYCEPEALAPHRVQMVTNDGDGIVLYGGGSDQEFGVTFVDPAPN